VRHDNPWRLVLWPAAATLAVTALRVTGELLNWTPALFSRSVGGGGALVGIVWLIPIFGAYFGHRLSSRTPEPPRLGKALGWNAAALVVLASFLAVGFAQPTASATQFLAIGLGSWAAIAVAWRGWPALVATLVRYGVLARIPVILVILLGILGHWRTHYDTPPPGLPEMGSLATWAAIGLIPQLTLWMAATVVLGLFVAAPVAAIVGMRARRLAEA
jgi:hypothetical protein